MPSTVDLLGFSRGGAQVAAFAPELPDVRSVVLLAPAFATSIEQAEIYKRAFGHPSRARDREGAQESACNSAPSIS